MPHMEGIFINGEKAKFHPEDILDTDASQYTEEIGESVTAYLGEHLTNPTNPPIDTSLSIAGAAADAKKTGDEISELKEDITQLDTDLYTHESVTNPVIWEQGRYDGPTGATGNISIRIRTQNFFGVFNGVLGCSSDGYMFLAHAWDAEDNYLGTWNGTTFAPGSWWLSSFDCTVNANYKYKLTVRKGTTGTDNITPSDGANIDFTLATTAELKVQTTKPSKNLGFTFESGSINIDTGLDLSGAGKRSNYVPVEEGKTYAFNVAESENAYNEYVFYYDENKTPIKIDTENNYYYTRWGMGWFPKTLTIPTGKGVKYIRVRQSKTFDAYHGQAEQNDFSTSYRSPELPEVNNTAMPNNIRGHIGKNVLLFGDSITAQNNWSKWFSASVQPNNLYNYAVGGAFWCDPTSGVTYDGTATPNVIGNQVQKAINNNLIDIDCIIILAGTNDTNVTFPSDTDIESAFFDGSMNAVALADVDRTTWQGAMRWCLGTLILRYPNAKIFVCSPVQRVYKSEEPVLSLYGTIKAKGETIEKMCKRMGVEFVDTEQCGISAARSLDFADGLHPTQRASEKIARYIIARYMAWFCQE